MFDDEKTVPSLILEIGLPPGRRWTPERLGPMVDGGVDGILLRFDGVGREEGLRVAHAVVATCAGRASVLLDGDLQVAAELGLGVLLSERGVGTAEVRRRVGEHALLGQRVGSSAAAAASVGTDFLVAEPLSAAGGSGVEGGRFGVLRRIVETVWVPVLAGVGIEERLVAGAMGAGAHGVVVGEGLLRVQPERAALRLRALVGRPPGVVGRAAAAAVGRAGEPAVGGGGSMTVEINGERTMLEPGTTVGDLIVEGAGWPESVVVTVNGIRVARRRFEAVVLGEGDRVEVVGVADFQVAGQ